MFPIVAQLIANGAVIGATYALLAIAFAVLFRLGRFYQFTLSSIYAIAAYGATLSLSLRSPVTLSRVVGALAVSVLCGVVLSLLFEIALYGPLRRKNTSALQLMLASIGAVVVVENVLAILFSPALRIAPPVGDTVLTVGPIKVTILRVGIFASCGILAVAVMLLSRYAVWGTITRAVASDPELAAARRIDTRVVLLVATAFAAALASTAAALNAFDSGARPQVGNTPTLIAIASVLIGGSDDIRGWALAGLAFGILQQTAIIAFTAKWADAVVFLLFCASILWRRRGLFAGVRIRA